MIGGIPMSKTTQTERVLSYMKEFGSITQMEAYQDIGVSRLAARIADLKKAGFPITSTMETVKNRYGENCSVKRYRINQEVQHGAS